jgi:hypothetical protein
MSTTHLDKNTKIPIVIKSPNNVDAIQSFAVHYAPFSSRCEFLPYYQQMAMEVSLLHQTSAVSGGQPRTPSAVSLRIYCTEEYHTKL